MAAPTSSGVVNRFPSGTNCSTAARKRVSRALRNLERQIRRRGVHGSTAALLIAAAAQQGAVTTQAGLASAAIAASATTSAPLLTLATIMSHTSVKIAACVSAVALAPLFVQRQANASLRAEIAALREAHPQVASAMNAAPSPQKEAALESEFAAKHAERIALENRVAQLTTLKDKLAGEVVISFGTIESMARKLARVLSTIHGLDATREKKLEAGSEAFKEREMLTRQMAEAMPEVMSIMREIPKLERDPGKAAHFYATIVGETLSLDQATRSMMETEMTEWVRGLQQDGLALVQRPRGIAKEWDTRRNEATRQLLTQLKAMLPPAQEGRSAMEDVSQLFSEGGVGLYEFLTTEGRP